MLYVVTGLPGSGKTLFALEFVEREFSGREIYYDGIQDLKLPWVPLVGGGAAWASVPDGSVVVIDEAQRIFRPRGTGAAVPEHVAALETHRHRGIDLVLITQHPKLLDSNVRRLCGAHRHIVRAFGARAGVVHAWAEICDDCDKSRADSLRTQWRYPVRLFAAYHSAEVHTHKARIPWKVFAAIVLPILGLLLLVGGVAYSYRQVVSKVPKLAPVVTPLVTETGAKSGGKVGGGASRARLSWTDYRSEVLESLRPVVPGFPHTALAYAEVTRPRSAPEPAGCVATVARCVCYTQQASALPEVGEALCRQIVKHGYFRAWQQPEERRAVRSLEAGLSNTSAPIVVPEDAVPEPARAGPAVGPREDILRRARVPAPRPRPITPAGRPQGGRLAGGS